MAEDVTAKEIAAAVLERHGQTFAAELGIDVARNTPTPLFRLLCAAILFSARIRAGIASEAARALFAEGWTTAGKLRESTWERRVRVLNAAGYARYDESTARMLGETAELVLHAYGGDLRRLRAKAGRDPAAERRLLKVFKGMGDVGVDIFFRECQLAWDELYPFADARALKAARRLGLGGDAAALAGLVARADFVRLLAGLVRVDLDDGYADVVAAAGRGAGGC